MNEPVGRSIFVTKLAEPLDALGVDGFVERAVHARLNGVWIRVGRGSGVDANLAHARLADLRRALAAAGIALWGWHVPFCRNAAKAREEAAKLIDSARTHQLAGIIGDAERTPESPRFQGDAAEARIYSTTLAQGLSADGRGAAFSSHDQPHLHQDLPFAAFLESLSAACPQVYDRSADPTARFRRSENGYRPILGDRFAERYRPTGNICIVGDVRFPNVATCLAAVRRFLELVEEGGYAGHSFWCWEEAPEEIWDLLNEIRPRSE